LIRAALIANYAYLVYNDRMETRPPAPLGERLWRSIFFYLSAMMAALALVDIDAGRPVGALGDSGVACLMLSLLPQFAFVRAVVSAGADPRQRADLSRRAEQLRRQHPWADRLGFVGWLMLVASLVLRAFGAG